ncbi:uncharacterized protein BDZ99DRAFT_540202 [Mytilinidion resinicola]|uniref:DUF3669 domain-containing protein n=1 Tax=Mytilinidion resinicola TaxID=574789 RepID=A0A6A6YAV1_9PEZI|nr:uncharacterized protein BDZ99DRAFT_540202 [Mytilinidion resinicola]KAF2805633.1 hypothetical protein BDZ99DRAFT_540202 [Mytilinidion resinicola]
MSSELFRCIGKGNCGSIWASDGDSNSFHVIKREDMNPGRSVRNDYEMHRRIIDAFSNTPTAMPHLVPECHTLIEQSDSKWWEDMSHRFPNHLDHCTSLISERIPRLPRSGRDYLVDMFCPLSRKEFTKSNRADDDCLVRAYLGRRRHRTGPTKSALQLFSLRNYPLHIDQMEQLQLDTLAYATTMADALAVMHWAAKVDASDVEFVLAPPREPGQPTSFKSSGLGEHIIWILDFDCCKPITMNMAGVEQACHAFFLNDPYYPRPHGTVLEDQGLWKEFRDRFLATSYRILGENSPYEILPTLLMDKIEESAMDRLRRKREIMEREKIHQT